MLNPVFVLPAVIATLLAPLDNPTPIGQEFTIDMPETCENIAVSQGIQQALSCGSLIISVPSTSALAFKFVSTYIGGVRFSASIIGVTVTDTRPGSLPWQLLGQMSPFNSSDGRSIPASVAGWTPKLLSGEATAGSDVSTGGDGLSVPRMMAFAGKGTHDAVVSGDIIVDLPNTTKAGRYTSILTLTLVS